MDLLPPDSLVIELGVAAGAFAEAMLRRNSSIRYVGIDRWSDHHDEAEMEHAISSTRNLATIAPHFMRCTFANGWQGFQRQADMIYIDGYAHTGQERGGTLRDWWPILKPGGIFAGHDYDAREYPQTVAAVDEFVREHRLEMHLTGENRLPSWWVRKPEIIA